jgi:hypothetical protein
LHVIERQGSWYIGNTPSSAVVIRSYSDLTIVCKKDDKAGTTKVKSSVKGMTAGNILLGGFVGLAVDAETGSGYDYPTIIHVQID